MRTADFDYDLPPERIAQQPAEKRDESRMLVLRRSTGAMEHVRFKDLPSLLHEGDAVVVNNTRVIPARLFGRKAGSGGRIELLLLEEVEPGIWDVLMRARRRPKPGTRFAFDVPELRAEMLQDGEMGRATVRFVCDGDFWDILPRVGQPPLPPYIQRKNTAPEQRHVDEERYQTIYARYPGAVAAPTAGLHFTEDILRALDAKGVLRVEITLHVGIGTFRPVEVDDIERHVMESERYTISNDAAEKINAVRRAGGRIVAIGSTSVRALETVVDADGVIHPGAGRTSLFIKPGYRFRAVDAMLTNFHLPRSTLLMMVCAFAGYENTMRAYREAVARSYRFYSYGDCMLIL